MPRRPLTLLLALMLVVPLSGAGPRTDDAMPGARIYDFDLTSTSRAPGAAGEGRLRLAWGPFGVATTEDGYLVYQLELTARGLLAPERLGPYGTYVVWAASPNLDRIERLGALGEGGTLRTRLEGWNKFLLLVTAEESAEVERRSGPVMLRGRSPSGFMASFQSHELFNNIPH